MILIIGGAYQGKLDTAKRKYNLSDEDVVNLKTEAIDFNKKIFYNFHDFIYSLILEGKDSTAFLESNMDKFKDKIIISDDISQGVVPIDSNFRLWREDLGRALGRITRESETVIRVFAGIETVIK
ncbi:MAG: cobalamin biosynthesis protein CobU [Lachnospiraceae bacterium]|jgi:hypothetical protein|nr:cobalamin biosynthesis protein CobU [Lachnospiraceae bacterium]